MGHFDLMSSRVSHRSGGTWLIHWLTRRQTRSLRDERQPHCGCQQHFVEIKLPRSLMLKRVLAILVLKSRILAGCLGNAASRTVIQAMPIAIRLVEARILSLAEALMSSVSCVRRGAHHISARLV